MTNISYKKLNWFEDDHNEKNSTFDYWNNAEIEKEKFWDIETNGFQNMEDNVEKKGLWRQLVELLGTDEIRGTGLSLASGICWLEAKMLKEFPDLDNIYCLDFSKHRIFDLAPTLLNHYQTPREKISLVWGDFYDLKIESNSLDFVVLCQAYHHAEMPDKLLNSIHRVLKKNGKIIILGEHYFGYKKRIYQTLKFFPKWLINHRDIRKVAPLPIPNWQALFPYSEEKGDNHYSRKNYLTMFAKQSFDIKHTVSKFNKIQAYYLVKK